MKKHLKADILEGYNIVGDGTPQALIPVNIYLTFIIYFLEQKN